MIDAILLLIAGAAQGPATPERFSVLVDPCASATGDHGKDVVVCGRTDSIGPRLPLRDHRGVPDHATPSNPDLRATRAMALEAPPCSANLRGCTTGFGPPVLPAITAAAGLVKGAFAKKVDKIGRIPIDLSDAAARPSPAPAP